MTIPKRIRLRWFWQFFSSHAAAIEFLWICAVVVLLIVEGYQKAETNWDLRAVPILALTVLAVVRLLLSYKKQTPSVLASNVEVVLQTILSIMEFEEKGATQQNLRLTVHIPYDKQGDRFQQVCDYVCRKPYPGTGGRVFKVHCGICGCAFREKKVCRSRRSQDSTDDDYMQELVKNWHYTEEDAGKLSKAPKSWIAIPLLDDKRKVVAVVYADSHVGNYFDDRRTKNLCICCSGLAIAIGLDNHGINHKDVRHIHE